MKKISLAYALVMLLALTAIMAIAQGPQATKAMNCSAACQKTLGLSQDQVAEMTRIRTAFMNDTSTLRTDLQAKMKEIAALWAAEDPNLSLIKQKYAEADQIRAEIRDRSIDTRGAILKVLTPAQRANCIKMCQGGQCDCGMCCGLGMGMGMCGGNSGTCPMGMGKGKGGGMGMGGGRGGCGGGVCPMQK